MKDSLIILTGPTAVGKTDLSIRLAKAVDGEIISADSIQVYKDMDIGSAKITTDEMNGVRHHLIDVLYPYEDFNVVTFKKMADDAISDIRSRGKVPIITGGTGFYIQAVLYDIDFKENEDDGYRAFLEKLLEEEGALYLHDMLKEIDEKSAQDIHFNNSKKVIRALEYYHQTGEKISEHNKAERAKSSPYNYAYFVLNCDRSKLYKRIEKRIDIMLEQGLIGEVQSLINKYKLTSDMVSMQGLGYKEIYAYLKGEISIDEAVYILKRDTRHFAKRQLTWFRREKDVLWVDKDIYDTDDKCLDYMLNILKDKR
ncbi:MAG: tRNA (adenosine(37)-N6)-dimethylallyltransferase MiaA, partial [Lachnospiraceae bacterium]|nr:tRNA (adenosine(37)-N6)-dimethylallyltransferase MiaA [Lachnospiraceae bacterium]